MITAKWEENGSNVTNLFPLWKLMEAKTKLINKKYHSIPICVYFQCRVHTQYQSAQKSQYWVHNTSTCQQARQLKTVKYSPISDPFHCIFSNSRSSSSSLPVGASITLRAFLCSFTSIPFVRTCIYLCQLRTIQDNRLTGNAN